MRAAIVGFFTALLVTSQVTPVRADAGAEYNHLLKDGVSEFSAGNWGEARLLFLKAHNLSPTARTYRGLGLCDFELRHYNEAISEFQSALAEQRRPLTVELRRQVEQALERAQQYVSRYELTVPRGVHEVKLDGQVMPIPADKQLLLDPGSHTLSVQPPEGDEIVRDVVAEVGGRKKLEFIAKRVPVAPAEVARASGPPEVAAPEVEPEATEPTSGPRVFTWVAAGLAGGFGAGIAAFGLTALTKHNQFVRQTNLYSNQVANGEPAMPPDAKLRESGRLFQTLANISVVGCAVAGVAAVTLFFVEGSASTERAPEPDAVQAGVGLGGAYVSGRF